MRPGSSAQRGQTLVEFALVGTLFFFVVFFLIGGAWFLAADDAVATAAREGARYGVEFPAGAATGDQCTYAQVQPVVVAGLGPFSGGATVTVTDSYSPSGLEYCSVQVQYPFNPVDIFSAMGSITISQTSVQYLS